MITRQRNILLSYLMLRLAHTLIDANATLVLSCRGQPEEGFDLSRSPRCYSYQLRPGGLEHSEEIPMEAEPQDRRADEGALPSLCLKQVYPKYAKHFNHLRLVERIAGLFIRFLGVKGNMRLGPTAFRTFIRYGAGVTVAVETVFAVTDVRLHA